MADGQIIIDVKVNGKDVDGAAKGMKGLETGSKSAGKSIRDMVAAMGLVKIASAAFNVLKSSIGDAVSRFDTMQKFPKVMKALGFSAEDSKKSINKLSDGIDGLPTKLDDVVSSTQQMTAITGDLDKSTNTVLALNNAFLASGASTDDASRGMQQYNQMLSTGQVDLESWKTLQETMPLALQKTAEAMGYTGKSAQRDLYAALKSGKVTFDDFQNNLIKLGTGTGMLAKLAKENSLGIGTSFGNLRNSISKGVANIIEKLDTLVKKLTGKSIAQNIDSLKGVINATFEAIGKGIDKATPYLEKIANFIKQNSDGLKKYGGVAAGVIGVLLGFSVVGKMFSGIGSVVGKLVNPFKSLSKLAPGLGKGVSSIGNAAKTSVSGIGGLGRTVLQIGIGIGVATAGISFFVLAIQKLAETGTNGVIAVAAITIAIAALAGVFALLGPALTANAVGIGVFGAAVTAIGLSIAAASVGLSLLINAFILLTANMNAIVPTMTAVGIGFANMIVGFLTVINTNIPIIVTTFSNMIIGFLTVLSTTAPLIITTFLNIITTFLTSLANAMPQLVASGMQIILSILAGIAANIGKIATKAIEIMVNFLNALATKMPDVITAGTKLIVSILNGIANKIGDIINAGVNLIIKFLQGIGNKIHDIVDAGMDLVDKIVAGIVQASDRLFDAAVDLINGLAESIENHQEPVKKAAGKLIKAIIGVFVPDSLIDAGEKIIGGFLKGMKSAWEGGKKFVGGITDWIKKNKGPISYDKRLLIPAGKAIMIGLNSGLKDQFSTVQKTVSGIAGEIDKSMQSALNLPKYTAEASIGISGMKNGTITGSVVTSLKNDKTASGVSLMNRKLDQLIAKDTNVYVGLDGEVIAENTNQNLGEKSRVVNYGLGVL
ncbi:tape measure protein [Listeria aquatica]|uniref:tape measure protein n=1 Tax=Listeria aquatica TaxID=1494960 RepID=UPI003F6E82F0